MYSPLTDKMYPIEPKNGGMTRCERFISHKDLRISWRIFQAQNSDFFKISQAQEILSDKKKCVLILNPCHDRTKPNRKLQDTVELRE